MPVYLDTGIAELKARAAKARIHLERCILCPRECRVDRSIGEWGECRTGDLARIYSFGPHFGEEAPLVGQGGSGTIFFMGCNLACVFCQNHDISQSDDEPGAGSSATAPRRRLYEETPEHIAHMMLSMQAMGCENINLVSPSHVVPQILAALIPAIEAGLTLPLVYNTGGYDAVNTLRLLDGVVDIYMPDMKYSDDLIGRRLSGVPDYARRNQEAVLEMHRQVGDLVLDDRGTAQRGFLVRHLVLPNEAAGTDGVAEYLVNAISPDTYINVMAQYRPAHDAHEHPKVDRTPTVSEYKKALDQVLAAGLWRLDERHPRRALEG